MTDFSARFALPLLQAGQAQKELFHNESLARIDVALHPKVATLARNDPPGSPLAGESWIVGGAPTGLWAGKSRQIASWTTGGWRFVSAVAGMTAWLADANRWAWYDGAAWQSGPLPVAGIAVNGHQVVGARAGAIGGATGGATVDAEARATLGAILSALRDHGLIDT